MTTNKDRAEEICRAHGLTGPNGEWHFMIIKDIEQAINEAEARGRESREEPSEEEINASASYRQLSCEACFRDGVSWAIKRMRRK